MTRDQYVIWFLAIAAGFSVMVHLMQPLQRADRIADCQRANPGYICDIKAVPVARKLPDYVKSDIKGE